MKVPIFIETVSFGKILLTLDAAGIDNPHAYALFEHNDEYVDISKSIDKNQLLSIISQAYKLGFEVGQNESNEAVRRVLYERKKPHYPKAIISKIERN